MSEALTIIRLCEFCGRAFSTPANNPWKIYCCAKCEAENACLSDYAPPMCDNNCGQPSIPRGRYCGDSCKHEALLACKKSGKTAAPARKSWQQKPGGPTPPAIMKLHARALEIGRTAAAEEAKITPSALHGRLWRYGLSASRQQK